MDRERVDRPRKFLRKRLIDQTVPLDPALPREGRRHNIDPEMGLAFRPMAGMPSVEVRLVDDPERLRAEGI